MIDITQLFAKTIPFVSLYDHCINTGNAAGLLWDLGVIKRSIIERNHLSLLASLHDLGKCHPFFQSIGINIVSYADQGFSFEIVCPTHMGVNLKKIEKLKLGSHMPHACGGEPGTNFTSDRHSSYAPPMWGGYTSMNGLLR